MNNYRYCFYIVFKLKKKQEYNEQDLEVLQVLEPAFYMDIPLIIL